MCTGVLTVNGRRFKGERVKTQDETGKMSEMSRLFSFKVKKISFLSQKN